MFNNVFDLYNHNILAYRKILLGLEKTKDIVSIIHGTGTGKSYIGLQLAYDFSKKIDIDDDSRILYIVPSHGIIEHLHEIIDSIPSLNFDRDFSKVDFITYQSLVYLSNDEIGKLKIKLLILDEFHHIGAPIWGEKINTLVETHDGMKVFGMTAYTVRDRGTIYERDMVNSDGSELFSNSVVSKYDICDAMIDGVLPKPIYKTTYIDLLDKEIKLEELVNSRDFSQKEKEEYLKILKDARKKILSAPSIKQLFKNNIKKDGKYLYFCPSTSEMGLNDIDSIIEETKGWLYEFL